MTTYLSKREALKKPSQAFLFGMCSHFGLLHSSRCLFQMLLQASRVTWSISACFFWCSWILANYGTSLHRVRPLDWVLLKWGPVCKVGAWVLPFGTRVRAALGSSLVQVCGRSQVLPFAIWVWAALGSSLMSSPPSNNTHVYMGLNRLFVPGITQKKIHNPKP
jgi:hypothetical protein